MLATLWPLSRSRILLLVALLATVCAVASVLLIHEGVLRDKPTGAPEQYWPMMIDAAPPVLTGTATRVAAGVNAGSDRSFELVWPATRTPTYFFVRCDQGKITLELSGGGSSIACKGENSVLAALGSHAREETITFTVEQNQSRDWGGALYR